MNLTDTWHEVLKAMRVPTAEMLTAAICSYQDVYQRQLTGTEAVVIWEAMIDEAFKEASRSN